jgi:hypothetical protein
MSLIRIPVKLRAIPAALIATAGLGVLAGCAGTVSSQSLVKPSLPLAEQAIVVSPDADPSAGGMRLVYAYGQADYTPRCDAPVATRPGPLERYGVTLCQDGKPLASAHFIAAASMQGYKIPDAAARRRLARIAAAALVPQPPVETPP